MSVGEEKKNVTSVQWSVLFTNFDCLDHRLQATVSHSFTSLTQTHVRSHMNHIDIFVCLFDLRKAARIRYSIFFLIDNVDIKINHRELICINRERRLLIFVMI